jgi:hypothetical protein
MTTVELENEVKVLKIKLEVLINHMEMEFSQPFGPPDGRTKYDLKVRTALTRAGLKDPSKIA